MYVDSKVKTWKPRWNQYKKVAHLTFVHHVTIAQSAPLVVARTVAARGMLYIKANSPKLPTPLYLPTSFSDPSSLVTTIENDPLSNDTMLD